MRVCVARHRRQLLLLFIHQIGHAYVDRPGASPVAAASFEGACAVLIFVVAFWLTARVRPYRFQTHNHMELFLCSYNVLLVSLALTYTIVEAQQGYVAALDVAMLVTLLASIAGVSVFLFRVARKALNNTSKLAMEIVQHARGLT